MRAYFCAGVLRFFLAVLALLALGTIACGGPGDGGRSFARLVEEEAFAVGDDGGAADAPLRLPAVPRVETIALDDERRPAVVLPEGTWSWRVEVPEGAWLQVGLGGGDLGPLEATVAVRDGSAREILEVARADSGTGWLDFGVDLSDFGGREVVLELDARRTSGRTEAPIAWAPVSLAAPRRPGADDRPNVLFIVVDTLRYDHLTSYGYERETSPEIQRLLAAEGTVMERAYSQAPWTLPSVTSYMTSRFPGEILGDDPATYGIPDGIGSLAESFAGLGYRTAGYFANPALHEGNGFARGFETFYSPDAPEAIERHADSVNRRALPWLRAHQDEPFFLYLHYIDPHDPYMNPDVVDGRSPWFDDPGGINGRWVHGVYTGQIPVDDLDREVRHFTALYDTEIRYVDRAIGELLDAIPPDVLADTLIVLTADHGEELQDHGGWKHGHTLYEDQIHVPLIFRWDGRIPAGRRAPGVVRLVDVAPTLLAATGAEAPPSWQGESLLAALRGDEPLPRLAAFAQQLQVFPLRTAAVLGDEKLILYNEREPFTPENWLQDWIYRLDAARLERLELYDLAADPRERSNLLASPAPDAASAAAAAVARLEPVVYRHLHRTLPGLVALTDAVPAGSRLVGEIELDAAPEAVVPLFLGPDDRVELAGTRLRFELVGEAVDKGFRLLGGPVGLRSVSLLLDGEPLPPARLRYAAGVPFTGREVPASALESDAFPPAGGPPGLRLSAYSGRTAVASEVSEETRRSLEALGYVQ
jgi:arylsulfatase A-like enzyme